MKAIVFLGGGRITGALAAGLRLGGYAGEIVVYDRHPEKLRALRRESRVEIARDLKSAVARAEMLIVAVRPASVAEMLREVASCGVAAPKLCVSLAAGIPLRKLRAGLAVRWARAMPSPGMPRGTRVYAAVFCVRRPEQRTHAATRLICAGGRGGRCSGKSVRRHHGRSVADSRISRACDVGQGRARRGAARQRGIAGCGSCARRRDWILARERREFGRFVARGGNARRDCRSDHGSDGRKWIRARSQEWYSGGREAGAAECEAMSGFR